MDVEQTLRRKFDALLPALDERSRRLVVAAEARVLGRGGVSLVARASGMSRPTIYAGLSDLDSAQTLPEGRVRRPGGGRKKLILHDRELPNKLEGLVEPLSRGDPESPLRWTCKSTRTLAAELRAMGTKISHTVVAELLHDLGYSLQANRKTQEGRQHPDRNAQFEHINACAAQDMRAGNPVISVDTKKKELVGNYKNNGEQWHRKGQAPQVNGHDFPGPTVPRAYPYGLYDLANNLGWVNVGTDHDTAAFAVASIRGWWNALGRKMYPHAKRLLITADAGGSNGVRLRLWKWELQRLADEAGIPISVCHFPPGTSKWNKIEHRLFAFISQNWRGEPLQSYATIVKLIAATKTKTGLRVICKLDRRTYRPGRKVTDKQLAQVRLTREAFHGDWNYTIHPRHLSEA